MSHLTKLTICFIKIYQFFFSLLLGQCCRFEPSCSAYAIEALKRHGFMKGCYFVFKRVLCCHPWHPGGMDPVPPYKCAPKKCDGLVP